MPLPPMIGDKGLLTGSAVSEFIQILTGVQCELKPVIMLYGLRIAFVESDSVPGSYYRLRKMHGIWNCSCPSDTFLTTDDYLAGRCCKHITRLREIKVHSRYCPEDVAIINWPVQEVTPLRGYPLAKRVAGTGYEMEGCGVKEV